MLCVSFNALTLMLGWQEGHSALKKHIPLILLEEENLRRNQLTWVHLEK